MRPSLPITTLLFLLRLPFSQEAAIGFPVNNPFAAPERDILHFLEEHHHHRHHDPVPSAVPSVAAAAPVSPQQPAMISGLPSAIPSPPQPSISASCIDSVSIPQATGGVEARGGALPDGYHLDHKRYGRLEERIAELLAWRKKMGMDD